MPIKDFFKKEGKQYLPATSANSLTGTVESPEFVTVFLEDKNRPVPLIDYSQPENFARFGSAEKYYYDAITRIYNSYPYDGSKKEKLQWELSSSHLDLYIFENGYPRTTGYANFLTSVATSGEEGDDYYPPASTDEYIFIKGGPHAGEGTKVYINPDTGEAQYRKNANVYDIAKNRECNLKIGGTDGNTLEFWLKKDAFVADQDYFEVIYDGHVTGTVRTDDDYGRFTLSLATKGTAGQGAGTEKVFHYTYQSGTTKISNYIGATTLTTASVADGNWHHYAFRIKTEGSDTVADLFVDGEHSDRQTTIGAAIGYVSGSVVATIGAQVFSIDDGLSDYGERGWSKFSGSIDELRYWKVWRSSEQIQTRWFDQVAGGTNTDDANTDLGLYYKFNEGITLTASIDSTVLDYSGRISNGTWTGYDSTNSRNTGSAIDTANALTTAFSGSEWKDPILYSFHPDVKDYISSQRASGSIHDWQNQSNLYYTLPTWIIEEHDSVSTEGDNIIDNDLWNLFQIISSYFDDMATKIKAFPQISLPEYVSGTVKPVPFMDRLLEGKNFASPEIFSALSALETFESRDELLLYEEKVHDVKNMIYRNIYNNLTHINKSKGTEQSFRNLIRCYGIEDEIYHFSLYSNNADHTFRKNYRSIVERNKLINHNIIANKNATILQYSSSLNTNSTTFISASGDTDVATSQETSMPFSVQANIVFPKRASSYTDVKLNYGDETYINNYPLMITSSLFGMHTAYKDNPDVTEWHANDYANFVVRAIKPETYTNKAKFVLTGTAGGFFPELTSSEFNEVYDDRQWSFLVSLYPEKYKNAKQVPGTSGSLENYIVEFAGVHNILDTTIHEFTVTGTINAEEAVKFLASPKRVFVGAHRTNFTGTVLQQTDVLQNNLRVWQNRITYDELKNYASNPKNYGITDPAKNAYLFNSSINQVYVPKKETLLLNWDYETVTGSDGSGEFLVDDLTSGSVNQFARYGWLSNLKKQQYLGLGFGFDTNSTTVIKSQELITAKPNLPETMGSDDMIKILQNDDLYFTRDKRPVFFDLYIEKSPYQNISDDMMEFLSTAIDFNNLIGHGVDRYRSEYKALGILRQLFFERISAAPAIDKYIEYFKWFDIAVASMIQKIAPMSSGLDERPLRNIIESHILERNKYQSKFPSYEFKQSDPEASLLGINEMLYSWKYNHGRLSKAQGTLFFVNPGTATDGSESVTIISTDGTSITYTAENANDYPNNEFDASGSPTDNVTQLMGAINAPAGHNQGVANSKLILESTIVGVGRLLTMTQVEQGVDGNTTITSNLANTTVVSFTGGSNVETNCPWWHERAARTNPVITSGDANIDSNRQSILDVINNENNATAPNLSGSSGTYEGSTYALRKFARPYKIRTDVQPENHGGTNFNRNRKVDFLRSFLRPDLDDSDDYGLIANSDYIPTSSCNDETIPPEIKKTYQHFPLRDGADTWQYSDRFIAPFNIMSASQELKDSGGGSLFGTNKYQITNIHFDGYGDVAAAPMQGPFTNAHVGGSQHRHIPVNTGSDDINTRPELFRFRNIALDTLYIYSPDFGLDGFIDPDLPRASYYRDEISKRPVNIKNIKSTTGSAATSTIAVNPPPAARENLGNYSEDYEIVLTSGRSINNRFLIEAEGDIAIASADNYYLSGVIDFALPNRELTGSNKHVFVNRFSAPGDPATMAEGMLDVEAGEYSVYNALPWRNLMVRQPLDELYRNHCKQFGYFSDAFNSSSYVLAGLSYPGTSGSVNTGSYYRFDAYQDATASFHKINRNGRIQPFLDESELDEYTNTKLLQLRIIGHNVNIGMATTWDALIGNAAGSNQKYTFSAWIYAIALNHAGGGNEPRILDFGNQDIALLIRDTGELQLDNRFTKWSGQWKTPAGTITTGRWIHVAVTYDANSTANDPIFYVDGQKVSTVTETSTPAGTNYGILVQDGYIGDRQGGGRNFLGYMDEISIWNDVLTGKEIEEIFLGSRNYIYRGGVGNLDHHSAVSKLISWWRSDSYTGASPLVLPDDKGSNDGTLADASMVIDNDGASVEKLLPVITHHEQTEKTYDNWFVQHQIPQTDAQYAWITASLVSDYSGSALFGFEQPDFSNASLASTDLTFATASEIGTWFNFGRRGPYVPGDALYIPTHQTWITTIPNINSNFYEPVSSSTNTLGYPISTDVREYGNKGINNGNLWSASPFIDWGKAFRMLMIKRNGMTGWAPFKHMRKEQHPIVRTHRQENRISYLERAQGNNSDGIIIYTDSIASAIEPPITSKYKPMVHKVIAKKNIAIDPNLVDTQTSSIAHTYLNNKTYFTDHSADGISLNKAILDPGKNSKAEQQTLDVINYYLNTNDFIGMPQFNPIDELISYKVTETVFPKEQFTYLSGTRGRLNYICPFWRETHEERIQNDVENSIGFTVPTQSMWAMDARLNVATATPQTGGYDGAGELQNNGVIFLDENGKHLVSPLYAIAISSSAGQISIDTPWDAGIQSGLDPFASSYATYVLEMKNLGKDYGILPEFRISEHMTDYIDSGFDINARNPSIVGKADKPFLSLSGTVLDNTDPAFYKTYSNSDFLKFFVTRVEEDDGTVLASVKLKCKALMKFLPYDGFYPVQRTVQLANLFSASYFAGRDLSSGSQRAGITPFFAPGIMYNSIKAGIGIPFQMPMFTGSTAITWPFGYELSTAGMSTAFTHHTRKYMSQQTFKKFPFESIIEPEAYATNVSLNGNDETKLKWYDLFIDEGTFITGSGGNQATSFLFDGFKENTLKYSLAANNFFAETINFFLPQGRMSNIVSLPNGHPSFGKNIKAFQNTSGDKNFKSYAMRLSLAESIDAHKIVPGAPVGFTNYNTMEGYGVPCDTQKEYSLFTPSYYHGDSNVYQGYSYIDFEFIPENPSIIDEYSLGDIWANMTTTIRRQASITPGAGTTACDRIDINDHLNIGLGSILKTEYDAISGQAITVSDSPEGNEQLEVIIIEPKWECPMHNFKDVDITTVAKGSNFCNVASGDFEQTRGIWHQLGTYNEKEGIYMSLADGPYVDNANTGSLADLLGFNKTNGKEPKRIGKLSATKEISEAVVAIPYRVIDNKKVTYKIRRGVITQAELILDGKQSQLPDEALPDSSIVEMVRKMREYVIPPHMDFITYSNKVPGKDNIEPVEQIAGGPFAMYIFEFKHQLTQQDLSNIWQNLPPVSMGAAPYYHESEEVSIFHKVFNHDFLTPLNGEYFTSEDDERKISQNMVEEIQWMVFKVKKRAATNYFDKTTNINDGGEFQFKFVNQDTGFPKMTYNWPYDYFSMVELVKLDAEFTMAPVDGKVKKHDKPQDGKDVYSADILDDKGGPPPDGTV